MFHILGKSAGIEEVISAANSILRMDGIVNEKGEIVTTSRRWAGLYTYFVPNSRCQPLLVHSDQRVTNSLLNAPPVCHLFCSFMMGPSSFQLLATH
jgi:hypothetical protein